MLKSILAALALVVLVFGLWFLLKPAPTGWELRVKLPGATHDRIFRGFKSEEECYSFYEQHKGSVELPHGCYPLAQ